MADKRKSEKKLKARIKELEQLVAERDATIDSLKAEFETFETKQNMRMWSRLFKPVGVQAPPDRARVLYIRYREDGYEKQAARDAVNLNLTEEYPELFAKNPPRKDGVVAFYEDDYLRETVLVDLD